MRQGKPFLRLSHNPLLCWDGQLYHVSRARVRLRGDDLRTVVAKARSTGIYVAERCFDSTHMQELKAWDSFMHLPHRHTFDRMSVLPESLLYPLKNFSLPAILLRVTEEHSAFW
jgi:hypothetical protein